MIESVLDEFKKLNENSIRYAVFAGSEVSILTNIRQATDLDLLVFDDDFNKMCSLYPDAIRKSANVKITKNSEGDQIVSRADILSFKVRETDFDIMARAVFIDHNIEYPTSLTDLAIKNRIYKTYDGIKVWLANPVDTIIIKSFLRRGKEQGKYDFDDCVALVNQCPIDEVYLQVRLKEIGTNDEASDFLRKLSIV